MTPSTYLERLVERLTDSMDAMIRTSVVQFADRVAIAAGRLFASLPDVASSSVARRLPEQKTRGLRPRLTPGVPLSPDQSGERNDSDAHGYPRVEPDIRVLFRADS